MESPMSKWTAVLLSLLLSTQLHAGALEYLGTVPISISSKELNNPALSNETQKIVYVQKIHLSPEAQQVLRERLENSSEDQPMTLQKSTLNNVPVQITLGMNNTPVLDQGAHGSCVTFAITGALDAAIGKGDYISQLCSLELGDYLQQNNKAKYSGWDGSFGSVVLNQFLDYGIITKSYQQEIGCAGVKRYPLTNERNTGKPMPLSEYSANALPLANYATWEVLVDVDQSFTKNHNPSALLRSIKKNLREGKRITFGMLLDGSQGQAGAMGTYHTRFDTWVLTPEIIKRAKNGKLDEGHEMIITGYDDQAEIKDYKGRISKGIFILRNSWGKNVGDEGTFYISYDYFKALSDEAHVIIPIH